MTGEGIFFCDYMLDFKPFSGTTRLHLKLASMAVLFRTRAALFSAAVAQRVRFTPQSQ
jgi:hypothetical protein